MPVSGYEPRYSTYTRERAKVRRDLALADDRPPAERETAWRPGDDDDRPTFGDLSWRERRGL